MVEAPEGASLDLHRCSSAESPVVVELHQCNSFELLVVVVELGLMQEPASGRRAHAPPADTAVRDQRAAARYDVVQLQSHSPAVISPVQPLC